MRRLVVGGFLLALLAGLGTAPSRGAETRRLVAPGVELHTFTRVDPAVGVQQVSVLRFRLGSGVSMRPVLALDHGARRLGLRDMVLTSGALAAVNGNFFTPSGNVRGIHTSNGVLRSEPEAPMNGAGRPRAAWRIGEEGLAFGNPSSRLAMTIRGTPVGLNGIDRSLGYLGNPDEAVLETSNYGAATPTPPEGADIVLGPLAPVKPNVDMATTVVGAHDGPGPIPPQSGVLSSQGANAANLRAMAIAAGDPVTLRVDIDDPAFSAAPFAGGGGPWLVRAGQPVPRAEQLDEGFTVRHLDMKAPRTAMGRTALGEVLLATIDGRQPGRSEGATIDSLTGLMVELGALDAISLDGGGSTELVVDGLVVNVPSGEDTTGRRGAEVSMPDAVGVFYDFTPLITKRLAGRDRVDTAVAVSQGRASARTVVLATASGFADALVGGPLAAKLGGPVLLTAPEGLDPRVADEITRLGAQEVLVLGGQAALGQQIEIDLMVRNLAWRRIAGADRYETAAKVAGEMGPAETVLLASGERFPDALAAGALGLPVLLTPREMLVESTRRAVGPAQVVVVGGSAAVHPGIFPTAPRLAGADRYGTATLVADYGIEQGRYDATRLLLTRGDDFPDALVGGALRRPLLLAGRFTLAASPITRTWLETHRGAVEALLLGGRAALSTMTQIEIEQALTAAS